MRNRKLTSTFCLTSWVLMPAALLVSAAEAQTVPVMASTDDKQSQPPGQPAQLEEVIVTAQKRAERLQDVPGSVAVETGANLRAMGATDYADFLNSIPSVSYAQNGGYKDKIFIRGLSDSLSSRVLSTTGIYIDETPVTEVDASLADLGTFDINRIEVLRGPQGTLFGSGSMGGTVRIITNKPDFDGVSALFDGSVGGIHHGGTSYETNAMVNIPVIADVLAIRAVGGYRSDGGYIDNLFTGRDDVNDEKTSYARVQADLRPSENLDVLLGVQYQNQNLPYGNFQDIGLPDYTINHLFPEDNDYITRIYTATLNYTLPFATITSATSYINKSNFSSRDFTNAYGGDYVTATGTTVPNFGISLNNIYPNKAFTQEARIASSSSGPLHWLAGVYYNNFHPHNVQQLVSNIPQLAAFDFGTADITSYRRELAEFGEFSFDITQRLQVTAGVRHSAFVIGQGETDSGYEFGDVVAPVLVAKQNKTVFKYRADYKLSPDNLVYAVASQGYRPGAPDSNFGDQCLPELKALGYATPPTQYKADSLWNYEIGSKNEFLDRRVTVNADGYYIQWDNTQVAQNLQCGYQFISNAGGAHVKGAELEMTFRPLPGLDFSVAGAYTEATFTTTNLQINTREGAMLPNVPRWTVSSSGNYTWALGTNLEAYLHGDVQYVDSRYSDLPLRPSTVLEPSYVLLNARCGVIRGKWDLSLFAKNLTDEIAILNTTNTSGLNYQSINQPRTVGVEVKVAL